MSNAAEGLDGAAEAGGEQGGARRASIFARTGQPKASTFTLYYPPPPPPVWDLEKVGRVLPANI